MIFLTLLKISCTIKVYQSTINIPEAKISGIHFRNVQEHSNLSNDLSVCVRINFKRFDRDFCTKILDFGSFLWLHAPNTPGTWLGFGNYDKTNAYSNWILREPQNNDYDIWTVNTWHHFCMGYSKLKSEVQVVKVKIALILHFFTLKLSTCHFFLVVVFGLSVKVHRVTILQVNYI